MPSRSVILPGGATPPLSVPLAGGGRWVLTEQQPEHFTLIVFYRGLHCPICKKQLRELEEKRGAFQKRGVGVVAISSDNEARAEKTREKWGLGELPIGYNFPLEEALDWGLYLSSAREGTEEPEKFHEPGLFLVRPDGALYFASIQSMPFARPHFDDILSAIDFVIEKDYPPRGERADI